MRLIDADAMKENVIDKTDGYYEYEVKQYHAWIDAQPTVNPKTAKWIETGQEEEWFDELFKCSECGRKMLCKHNFCPNCGAKMIER